MQVTNRRAAGSRDSHSIKGCPRKVGGGQLAVPDRREMPACALGKTPQGVNSRTMCCWGKLQTSLFSIPGSLHNLSPIRSSSRRILGVPSPLGPFSSLPNSAPPSIRKREGGMTPP